MARNSRTRRSVGAGVVLTNARLRAIVTVGSVGLAFLAALAALVPSRLSAHAGGSAGYGGTRASESEGRVCDGQLDEPSSFRASIESLMRSCYTTAYIRERGLEPAMVDLEVRVRDSSLKITTFEGAPGAGVDQCIRAGLRRVSVHASGGCVDQYFRVPLRAPRFAAPTTPVTMDDASFDLLAALEPNEAPVEQLLDRTSVQIVPASRSTQQSFPVDLRNFVLVEPGSEVSFEPGSSSLPLARRGDVARVWLYMLHAYGIRLSRAELDTLLAWDREDPVDDAERERNRRIQVLQGNTNPFVGGAR